MSPWSAFFEGWRRLRRAPRLALGVWAVTLVVVLPLGLTLRPLVPRPLETTSAASPQGVTAEGAAIRADWRREVLAQSTGLAHTFVPPLLGIEAVLREFPRTAGGGPLATLVPLTVAAHAAVATLLLGGLLERLGRDRAMGLGGVTRAGAAHFGPLVRLAGCAGAAYAVLTLLVYPLLGGGVVALAAFGAALAAVDLVFSYAQVRLVLEQRRSAVGAILAACRFVWRARRRTLPLHVLQSAWTVVAVAAFVAAAAALQPAPVAPVVLVLFAAVRAVMRLAWFGGQVALLQSELAHAGYAARPLPA